MVRKGSSFSSEAQFVMCYLLEKHFVLGYLPAKGPCSGCGVPAHPFHRPVSYVHVIIYPTYAQSTSSLVVVVLLHIKRLGQNYRHWYAAYSRVDRHLQNIFPGKLRSGVFSLWV